MKIPGLRLKPIEVWDAHPSVRRASNKRLKLWLVGSAAMGMVIVFFVGVLIAALLQFETTYGSTTDPAASLDVGGALLGFFLFGLFLGWGVYGLFSLFSSAFVEYLVRRKNARKQDQDNPIIIEESSEPLPVVVQPPTLIKRLAARAEHIWNR